MYINKKKIINLKITLKFFNANLGAGRENRAATIYNINKILHVSAFSIEIYKDQPKYCFNISITDYKRYRT